MAGQRLQKIIAASGLCSRRKAEKLLTEERVKINGEIALLGSKANPEVDEILVDNLAIPKTITTKAFLLNKPAGVISSCVDSHGRKTVLDLIPKRIRKGLHPIGRLDLESRGAILLTNNGELTLKLTHPRYMHTKQYHVTIKGIPTERTINKWRNGVIIENKKTLKAKVDLIDIHPQQNFSVIRIILKEGRNRQIRKVGDELGHPVLDLQRTSIAGICLDQLKEGEWREISSSELESLSNLK